MITALGSDNRNIKKASDYKATTQSVYTPAVDEGTSKEREKERQGEILFCKSKKIGSVPSLSFCFYIKIKCIYKCMCPSIYRKTS